ncbi:MAG: precorrin-6Y C5,15-methyltransferase (decarboxylating) subunit CbiT [Dethiobacter sp.]|jgi:cobalt-precorrin-6B (C15)-methyltransferase|nr:precorrin-6Y C5,15-methyltransferase (decarboxylating) subunit CbiT [Dethiobacter sp.]MBS3900528.1 precorrin-6Y C5,15-methyltransferase (decarboxylating) subunit CbiT [Dethiobacter sp.]MBS3989366.1 precorrin-6Y C5,15-methyltransferase (decarboxylating) subunit CbiT [Dethiobacter sp.]
MNRQWPYLVPGIPDDAFERGSLPMTKREVRALTISAARLAPNLTVWDVGAGTGSLSVEAALFTPGGRVLAVEKSQEGVMLIQKNSQRFGVSQIELIHGEAPQALLGLPAPERVLIGGSGGRLEEIFTVCAKQLLVGGILVATVIAPRNLVKILDALAAAPFSEPEGVFIHASRLEKLGRENYFRAQNGVWIISARKEEA